jgi:hypothetical protein
MKLVLTAFVVLALSARIAGQDFAVTSPTGESPVPAGQPITVTWTGGPNANMVLLLISEQPFAEYANLGTAPNTGSRVVTIPAINGPGGTCGRRFLFYLEDSPRTTWRYGQYFTVVCRVAVGVDIKPGSFPNSINLGSSGATPVAILGSAAFDVSTIDVSTLTLGTAGVKTVGKADKYLCSVADVSGDFTAAPEGRADGFLDLVCHFNTINIVPEEGGTVATVKGDLLTGLPFEGSDSVTIVP